MNSVSTARKEYLLDEMSRFVSSNSEIIQMTYFRKEPSRPIECPDARCVHDNHCLGIGFDVDVPTAIIKSLAEAFGEVHFDSCQSQRHFFV